MAPTKRTYACLFIVTLTTLTYEILLTRIFSVSMWYHFAFMAISIAMFGMTVGAIVVYLLPRAFPEASADRQMGLNALLFAVTIVISFTLHLAIPFTPEASRRGLASVALTYSVIAIPFVFSGICVCIALTRFPKAVGKLYGVDLAGAALGCIFFIYLLDLTDGPTSVLVIATLASLGGALMLPTYSSAALRRATVACVALLAIGTTYGTVRSFQHRPLLKLRWVKGGEAPETLYETWNSFSFIRVAENTRLDRPFGWGLSSVAPMELQNRQLGLNIDAAAGTVLTEFDGDLEPLQYLRWDVTNVAHHLRGEGSVLIVGTGGGRDVLSALVFGHTNVVGVELNDDILDAVNREFGDFTGHLDQLDGVRFVNDEARSFIAREPDLYDIIQVSLIDTWAATAAGAYTLSENSLYTLEAWSLFLTRLTPSGVLTFSRWHYYERPGEMYRLASLANAALREVGVTRPRDHIMIVKSGYWGGEIGVGPEGVGTILVSREPFSEEDVAKLREVGEQMNFDLVLAPDFESDATFAELAGTEDLEAVVAELPINVAPPTDDSPFFFNMLRLRDMMRSDLRRQGQMTVNAAAVTVLGLLLLTVVGLTAVCIIVPLLLTTGRGVLTGAWPLLVYFSCIGIAFMLVEISQMQRLIVFLGHPTYSLSVVLFSLLLAGGVGSYASERFVADRLKERAPVVLALLLLVVVAFGLTTPYAIRLFEGAVNPVRIGVSATILTVLGLFMGTAFPVGMRVAWARQSGGELTPWLWGINGATSVCASVLAVVIALTSGISASFWTGAAVYGIALGVLVVALRGVPATAT